MDSSGAVPKNWKNRARTAGRIMLFCFFALNPLAGWFYLNRIPKRDRKPGIDDNRLDAYRSIAVLPFARGSDTDSDGLTREIPRLTIEKLEETRAFFVSRWEETEFFDDPLAAGEALDVDTALMGEVSEWNETISVRVRLVKVKGGVTIWSDAFEWDPGRSTNPAEEISSALCQALQFRLTAGIGVRVDPEMIMGQEPPDGGVTSHQ